jgi:hypothetical protein
MAIIPRRLAGRGASKPGVVFSKNVVVAVPSEWGPLLPDLQPPQFLSMGARDRAECAWSIAPAEVGMPGECAAREALLSEIDYSVAAIDRSSAENLLLTKECLL